MVKKSIIYVGCALALFSNVFVSCSSGNEPVVGEENLNKVAPLTVTITSQATRMSIGEENNGQFPLSWEAGDVLYAYSPFYNQGRGGITVLSYQTIDSQGNATFTSAEGHYVPGDIYLYYAPGVKPSDIPTDLTQKDWTLSRKGEDKSVLIIGNLIKENPFYVRSQTAKVDDKGTVTSKPLQGWCALLKFNIPERIIKQYWNKDIASIDFTVNTDKGYPQSVTLPLTFGSTTFGDQWGSSLHDKFSTEEAESLYTDLENSNGNVYIPLPPMTDAYSNITISFNITTTKGESVTYGCKINKDLVINLKEGNDKIYNLGSIENWSSKSGR